MQKPEEEKELNIVIDNDSTEDPTQPETYETYKYDDSVSTFDGYTNNVAESEDDAAENNNKE